MRSKRLLATLLTAATVSALGGLAVANASSRSAAPAAEVESDDSKIGRAHV